MNRRETLRSLTFAAGIPLLLAKRNLFQPGWWIEDEDKLLCKKKFELGVSKGWAKKPINEVIVEVGKTFLGTEYVAHAIEAPGEEHLVVNMRGLDCVSFYENSLVIARCLKKNKLTFDDYRRDLQFIRYRGGIINGYPSRLHYTSDYFYDDEKRGIWKLIAKDLGGKRFVKTLNFMSTHPEMYRQINENPGFAGTIAAQEKEISKRETYYVPKNKVEGISDKLMAGDIIGITTDIEGIDTSHTGILIKQDRTVYFMHAPLAGKKVQISEKPFHEYLDANKRQTGIMVARPLEPV
jgi:hypothetical protein